MNGRLHLNRDDTDALVTLKSSGADLSDYRDQLARERSARTLTLRRTNRTSIASLIGKPKVTSGPLVDVSNFPFLDPNYVCNTLRSGSISNLEEMLNNICGFTQTSSKLLKNVYLNEELPSVFIEALGNGLPSLQVVNILKTISVIFPKCEANQIRYIDEGLTMLMFDFLSSEDINILYAAICLIDVIVEVSSYARDSILSFGLHISLIEIAQMNHNQQLIISACETLYHVFSNPQSIDSTTLTSCVEPMASLLFLQDDQAEAIVLNTFVAMTNKMPALVFTMYDLDLFKHVVGLLSNENLIAATLPLIGNMSVGHAENIRTLLNCGLLEILMQLIDSSFTADVFWVLSNLVESMPHVMMEKFDMEFVHNVADVADASSFEVKKEASFFIATLILFTDSQDLIGFMFKTVLEVLVEMLGCGVGLIILRCLDALLRFSYALQSTVNDDFVALIHESDLADSLNRLTNEGSTLIQERAEFLLNQLEGGGDSLLLL